MSNFNIGDSVEVLPCTEGGALHELAHCQVAGRRGTVLIVRDGGRSMGVHFPGLCGNNLFGNITATTGWWCDPDWLRRVRPTAIRHGEWGCNCACCRYAFRCAVLGHPEKDPGVVCTPDGTLCSKADKGGLSLNWDYCPYCGGRLKEG